LSRSRSKSIHSLLLCSHWFSPSLGGVETVSEILAQQFSRFGVAVTVVTATPGPNIDAPYAVVRQPSQFNLHQLAKKADVVMQNTVSLRTLAPMLLNRLPTVVTHHSWMRRADGTLGAENIAKRVAIRACHNVSISHAIAAALPVPSVVIGDPYEASEFSALRTRTRDRDLVFMARLIGDKGCDLLLHALRKLQVKGMFPSLTVIGDGPEMATLRALTVELGLGKQVEFLGSVREGRGEILARHRIMVVPSTWAEPFGVVALEGIASGCAIVASSQGGLPDAVGPCGLYFPNRDTDALADRLQTLLSDPELQDELVAKGPGHLQQFQPEVIAGRYLDVFTALLN
jgi:glycogen synthase